MMGAGDPGDIVNKQDLFDLFYPIGSIYLSTNNINPNTLFGNTWEQIQDTFLLAAGSTYSAGSTGGEANHTLTESELPGHTHTLSSHTHSLQSHTHSLQSHTHSLSNHTHSFQQQYYLGKGTMGYNGQAITGNGNERQLGTWNAMPATTTGGPSNNTSGGPSNNTSGGPSNNTSGGPSTNVSGSTGSGNSHNNMPPYLAVYMWKRIA